MLRANRAQIRLGKFLICLEICCSYLNYSAGRGWPMLLVVTEPSKLWCRISKVAQHGAMVIYSG